MLFLLAFSVGLLGGAGVEAASGTFFGNRWRWDEMAVRVVLFTLLTPPGWRLVWTAVDREWFRQHPAARERKRRAEILAPVLSSGVLPDDIDRTAWRRAMRDAKQELEAIRWSWSIANAVVAVLTAAAAIVANDNAWTVWAVAVVVAAQSAAAVRLTRPKLRTARRLLAELSEGAPATRP